MQLYYKPFAGAKAMRIYMPWLSALITAFLLVVGSAAQAATPGWRLTAEAKEYHEAWGVNPKYLGGGAGPFHENGKVRVQVIAANAVGNLFWPGEKPELTLQFENLTDQPIAAKGKLDLLQWGLRIEMDDMWGQHLFRIAECGQTPIEVNIPAKGFQNLVVKPKLPDTFGAYALIVDLEGQDRLLGALLARAMKVKPEKVQYPVMSLDGGSDPAMLERIGIKAVRIQIDFPPFKNSRRFVDLQIRWKKELDAYHKHNVTVCGMAQGGDMGPLGGRGGHFDKDGQQMGCWDWAWGPELDQEFEDWMFLMTSSYGWPNGPINSWHLWNEPWNGGSIAGWGADDPRYREIYARMVKGIERARKESGVEVLVGGCDSTSNARDKLFSDGKDTFLKSFDFVSEHYQCTSSDATQKSWLDRKPRVQFWDTESWIANSEAQVASSIATLRSAGYDRVRGLMWTSVMHLKDVDVRTEKGTEKREIVQALSLAPAVAACTQLIGDRPFKELLFKNGLPWVMVFDGLPGADGKPNQEDGTVVVVGDLGAVFGGGWPDSMLFRTARSFKERALTAELKAKLAALPAEAKPEERTALEKELNAKRPLLGSTLAVKAEKDFSAIDPYGNPMAPVEGRYVIPLGKEGYFLRGDGKKGSFEALLAALREASLAGIEPLAKACSDMTAPIGGKPALRLKLTNVLNQPVKGKLSVKLGGLQVEAPAELSFAAHETKEVPVRVTGGQPEPSNTYPLTMVFDAGADGKSTHQEDMHCNVIARRTIKVDGKLGDWEGALPQIINDSGNAAPTMTEAAWFPMRTFDTSVKKGAATAYLAADDENFYFAAKVADSTPDAGMPRFEALDANEFFYPEVVYRKAFNRNDFTRDFSARWTGFVQARVSGKHVFTTRHDDGVRVWVAGTLLIDRWKESGDHSGSIDLEAGKRYPLKVEYCQGGGGNTLQLLWQEPEKRKEVVPAEVLFAAVDTGALGLAAEFYRGTELKELALKRTDATIDYPAFVGEVGKPSFVAAKATMTELRWPEGVRRFTYKNWGGFELPSGCGPNHDNVQIAFQVFPAGHDKKDDYPCVPGTMPGYIMYHDSDYIFALNPVAARYGGGTEIWRLKVPGMPRIHFYPRHPKPPQEGPAKGGRLVVTHEGNTRVVECSIPWVEIPEVKAKRDAGEPVKFSFRVNDNAGTACLELARERSVSKTNASAFRDDWIQHWANELEFGWER
jgi:hypothetical protein